MADPLAIARLRAIEKQQQSQPDPGLMGWTAPAGMQPYSGYSGWVSGRPVGPALPRPWDTFLSGAFGPFMPILPMPLDQPAEGGSGRPAPRRWQYPVGWNLPIGQPGSEGLTLAAFQTLRSLAQRYSTLWGMLDVRVRELVGLDWDVGPTRDAQQVAKSDKGVAKDQAARAKQVADWFRWHIDPNYTDGFQSWFTAALWDQFVMDAVAVHPLPTRVPGKGLFGSGLAHWELLDAATIRPLVDERGALPLPPAVAYQQYLWGVPRVDMMQVLAVGDADEADALMEAGGLHADLDDADPDGAYRMDQLHYWRQTPWTNTPYGLSPVAASLLPIVIGLQRQVWLNDYWSEGTIPGVFVVAGPAYATATQQLQLQNSLNSLAGDVAWKHRVIVLPPDSKALPQKDLSFSKDVDLSIIEYLYPVLHVMPQEIGQMPGGRTSGLGGSSASQEMMDATVRQRTRPDRKVWKQRFDALIQQGFGQADLEWKWVEFEEQEDAEKKAAAEASEIGHGQKTIDQVIVDNGGDPWGLPLTSTPIFVMGTGIIPLDPEVTAPAPIAPGGTVPGAPAGGSDAEPNAPSGAPAGTAPQTREPAVAPSKPPERSGTPSEGEGTQGDGPTPSPSDAGSSASKLSLADVVKWRIRYKGKKLPSTIHGYLLRSYPEDQVKWAADDRIDWRMEPHVKLDDINWRRRPGGRNPEKEAEIADSLARGATMDPIVVCEFASKGVYNRAGLTVADGYHRTGGADKAGWKDVPAFVGTNVPDEYRDRIRGSMQDESASVSGKAQLAELAVLRRYAKAGRDVTNFVTSALTPEQVELFAGDAAIRDADRAFLTSASILAGRDLSGMTVEQAHKAARQSLDKDFAVSSPVASGLAPFDLEGAAPNAEAPHPTRCRRCGTPLLGSPDVPISEAAVGLCGDCQVAEATGTPIPTDKGLLAGHGTAPIGQHSDVITESPFYPAEKSADLLALIDVELARRGVDLTKLA